MFRSKAKCNHSQKKIWLAGVLLFVSWFVWTVPAAAFDIPSHTSQFYVNDFAGLLSEDTEEYVVSVNMQLYEKCGAQIVITTIEDLNGAPLEEYATDMFRTYGIGDKEKNNGVLLLLALNDRACRIEIGYGLEGAINDSKSGRIQDDYMIPYFKDGKWDEGMRNGFDAITLEIAKEYDIQVNSNEPVVKITSEKEKTSIGEKSNRVGMIAMGIALVAGLLMGALIPWFWIGIVSCLLSPFAGHFLMKAYFSEMDALFLFMSDFGVLIFYFVGWAITTKTVDRSSISGGDDYSGYSGSSNSHRSSSSSSHSSSGRSNSGGGGRSGGGGSSRRF